MHLPKNTGSALIVTMFITMILMLVGLYLLEKIVPLSRAVKGVENGNVAYYQANSAAEEALLHISPSSIGTEYASGNVVSNLGWQVNTFSSGTSIPANGKGNSPDDTSYNIISLNSPVQLRLPSGINWSTVGFYFKTPTGTLSKTTNPIVSWTLISSGTTNMLSSSGGEFIANEITGSSKSINTRNGSDVDGHPSSFPAFYTANCS